MDWHGLRVGDGSELVDRLTDHVHDASECATTNGHGNRAALIDSFHTAHHALSCFHSDAADAAFAQVLLHFDDDVYRRGHSKAVAHDAERLIDRRHIGFAKLHVHGRARDLNHISNIFWHISILSSVET